MMTSNEDKAESSTVRYLRSLGMRTVMERKSTDAKLKAYGLSH